MPVQRSVAELERKFPGVKAIETPIKTEAQVVGSPIDEDAHAKMSDESWLRAMRKYSGDVTHEVWHRGGAHQLADRLQRRVQQEPARFYRLALRAPDDTDDAYVKAFIGGLAESDAPADWLYDVVNRFANQPGRDIRRDVAWALEKRCDEGLRDDMVELLGAVVRGQMRKEEEREEWDQEGLSSVYLNSDRGASFKTLMHALEGRSGAESRERMWSLIEYATADPSSVLRLGAIEELLHYLLAEDRERGVTLFEKLMEGYPELLCTHETAEFLYYGSYQHFSRTKPFIQTMMNSRKDDCAQRGAELACVAAISPPSALGSDEALSKAQALAESAVTGSPAKRRGAANIYARNMDSEQSAFCARELSRLVDDEDDEVSRLVASSFSRVRSIHDPDTRRFVKQFAASRALANSQEGFAEFLWEYGPDDPFWALSVLETTLSNCHKRDSIRSGGEELVRLVLRVYTDPTANAALRERAMDAFDKLMERYVYEAQRALDEWDQG